MSFPFPLLRLPRLVLCEVFKSLNIGEKIKLSICSKKVSTQINYCRLYSQKVHVHLDMYSNKIEVSENGEDKFKIFNWSVSVIKTNRQQYQIEGRTVSVISYNKGINAFWENDQKGFLSVLRYLSKIFQCKFLISDNYKYDSYEKTISELFDLQVEFKILTICLNGSKDENLLWNLISSNFGLVEDLRISSSFNSGFRPVFTSWPQKIYIMSSAWFTPKYLLTCTTCTTISLEGSLLENNDLDETLWKWQTGGFPNLEFMKILSHNITNNGTTILGMKLRELNRLVIQTNDGSKKATIKTGYGRIEMSVTPF
ncbi:hypothetical protein CRE_13778 [Caenorhabditis remanei]|uniref:F-box domain-containing protein n=1 Tax=Caenorhabditis remanei TaxID=31234 RepID=E3NK93_CAERE|nr:hypothetical protein CRE_13778 [Caenorhabditis remanei]